jgi:putative transposase
MPTARLRIRGGQAMPTVKRPPIAATDEWQQLQLLAPFPEQRAYELLRPVVLFGRPPAERAGETGTAERTIYRRAARCDAEGMGSLFAPPKIVKHRRLPEQVRRAIRDLRGEHTAFSASEIADICAVRFGHRPSPHTVKRILAEDPPPTHATRRFPPFHAILDPAERRLAVIRLHSEGWAVKSIAAYLQTGKRTVYRTLQRWLAEGVARLDDQSHARKGGPRKVTLRAIATVKELQENPRLGEFRIHAALRQQGIYLSPRTCGRILAKHRALYGVTRPEAAPREPKPLPFAATRPHECWSLDIRYLDHRLGTFKVYTITVLDNYSRAVLASLLSRSQDLAAVLMVLYAAIRQHGTPETLVADSGGVFLATHAQRIYQALTIRKAEIAQRQPWQNLIEANFGAQMRMADYGFASAATWEELLRVHEQWVDDFNGQAHWAHRQREDGRRTPAEVLGHVVARPVAEDTLHRVFYTLRFGRVLDARGYARFRHWKVYGERGLAGRPVGLWLYGPQLTVEHRDEPSPSSASPTPPASAS